jgi:hypothetical protein
MTDTPLAIYKARFIFSTSGIGARILARFHFAGIREIFRTADKRIRSVNIPGTATGQEVQHCAGREEPWSGSKILLILLSYPQFYIFTGERGIDSQNTDYDSNKESTRGRIRSTRPARETGPRSLTKRPNRRITLLRGS